MIEIGWNNYKEWNEKKNFEKQKHCYLKNKENPFHHFLSETVAMSTIPKWAMVVIATKNGGSFPPGISL